MPDGKTLFEQVALGNRGPRVPVWIMRQAGRYLPEYRKLRENVDFLTATKTPDVAARITLQPMERFALDAAILFSDIMTPLEGMGVTLEFSPGPVVAEPIRSSHHVESLRFLTPDEHVPYVLETIRVVRNELDERRALIGFAGAPFTLLCYLVQGRGSKEFMEARSFLHQETSAALALLDLLGRSMAGYLIAQARAGADAVMLFDSWAGLLGPEPYRRFVLPGLKHIVAEYKRETSKPLIYFARGSGTFIDVIAEVGADVYGIDWNLPLSRAIPQLGTEAVVQGNMDPAYLFAPPDVLGSEIDGVLESGAAASGHIFNLGHGIHQTTDPGQVAFLVDRVHETSERMGLEPVTTEH